MWQLGAGDVIGNPATRSQVAYAAGHVVAADSATFAEDAGTAEIHLVVNDHGPAIPGMVADMLSSYRAGCSDASPFPGIFPASALADGTPGPNICRLAQSAIFTP